MVQEESFGVVPLSQEKGRWKIFLILHIAGRHWGFPKGHLNAGETPLEAAKRELKEETGLNIISLIRPEPFIETYRFSRRGKPVSKTVQYFAAEVEGEVILQPEEIRDGRWFSFKEAIRVLSFQEARAICHELIKILNIPEGG
ncbi:MAG: NUDIX domain-containing protein [Chlamydiales bacterium]|nr:NUDIX domain-containing protein [Chlamydiales bacterium]